MQTTRGGGTPLLPLPGIYVPIDLTRQGAIKYIHATHGIFLDFSIYTIWEK